MDQNEDDREKEQSLYENEDRTNNDDVEEVCCNGKTGDLYCKMVQAGASWCKMVQHGAK